MKTIQKSRNHNFRMRRLTNYRFLHTIRYDTVEEFNMYYLLCSNYAVTNAIRTGTND